MTAVLVFFKACAWFAVNSILRAFAVQTLIGAGFGPAFSIVTVAQVAIALVGYGFIHLVQKAMALVLPLLFIGVSLYGFTESDLGSGFDAAKAGPLGFVGAFALVAAIQAARALSFSSYAADYTRYMPVDTPPRKLFLYAFTGTWLGSVWIASLGAAIGTIAFIGTPTDLVGQVLPGALATVTMLALGVSTITSSCLDCYSGALAWLIAGVRMARWQAALTGPGGDILLEAENTVTTGRDATGHAETNLVRLATAKYEAGFLRTCTLYTSTEPCAMCSGAIYWGNVGRVVYALGEDELLALTGANEENPTMALPCREVFRAGQRPLLVVGPIDLPEAREIHAGFWN